jgi:transposase
MSKDMLRGGMMTIGLDVSDRYCHTCVLDAAGEIAEQSKLATKPDAVRCYFSSREPSRVALEVGTHSPWISRLLEECGHEVLVANPRKLRAIYENDAKDDQVDAEYLARIARLDPKLLRAIRHRSLHTQQDLAVIRGRDALVRSRTQLINHVRGAVKAQGLRLPSSSPRTIHKHAATFPAAVQSALCPLLQMITSANEQIDIYDCRILDLQERYPETQLLQQVHGVGPLTATTYVLTLENPERFTRSRHVGTYLGLVPKRDQSGDGDPQLRITKAGSPMLRRLLVSCAHYILGPFGKDCDLRRHGLMLAARGGKNAKKRAVVAVARKLAVLLHHLWITGEVYEPLRNAKPEVSTRVA